MHVCCLLVRTRSSRQPWHTLAPSFGGRASIHWSSEHPRSTSPCLKNAWRDLGRGFRAGGVVAGRGEQGPRVNGLQPSSCFCLFVFPERNGARRGQAGAISRAGGRGFSGHMHGDATGLGECWQATGMALLSMRVTSRSQSQSDSYRRPSRTLPYTHWKKRVTHVTQGPSFPPSSC